MGAYGVAVADGESATAERGFTMTPTARLAAAQRRKRQIISRTLIDRALSDPRRSDRPAPVPAAPK